MPMHPGYYGWGSGWIILGWVWMLAVIAGIIALVVWLVRRTGEHGPVEHRRSSALDIAKERYARGEITKEQYEQLKKDLQ